MNYGELDTKSLSQLEELGKKLGVSKSKPVEEVETKAGIKVDSKVKGTKVKTESKGNEKDSLIKDIMKHVAEKEGYKFIEGVLEVMSDNTHGVLRTDGVLQGDDDAYISGTQIRKFDLRTGDLVAGPARMPKDNEKYHSLLRVDLVWGGDPLVIGKRIRFEKSSPGPSFNTRPN